MRCTAASDLQLLMLRPAAADGVGLEGSHVHTVHLNDDDHPLDRGIGPYEEQEEQQGCSGLVLRILNLYETLDLQFCFKLGNSYSHGLQWKASLTKTELEHISI